MATDYGSFEWPPEGSGSGGSGTVTSIAIAVPSILTVSGSPITTSGTITLGLATELANTVFAGPSSGSPAVPTFRALVAADIPTLPYISTTLGATAISGGLTVSGNTLSTAQSSGSQNGWLSSTDWTTFNGKTSGGITALTGDVTASGPGSAAASLTATTNATLTTISTLVSVGTITTGTWAGTTIAVNHGGTGVTSLGNFTDAGTDGITVTGGTGAVITSMSIAQHVADATHNGYLASADWNTFNSKGSGTVTSVTFTGDGTVLSSTPSSAVTTSGTVTATLNTQTARTFLQGPQSGSAATPTFTALKAPTIQKFTSSSGTYTAPTSPVPLYINVRMIGGGGGGGGSGSSGGSAGGTGGNSTFGTSLLVSNGGVGGANAGGSGGAGGTASLGSGPIGTILTGGAGDGANAATTINSKGGYGAASPLGGAGGGSPEGNTAGVAAANNTGAGGGGAGSSTTGVNSGAGGGAAGWVDAIITSPSATYAYAVGAAGTGGTAGTSGSAGGAGGSGYIEVREFYQ